jgi:hypothetical protein
MRSVRQPPGCGCRGARVPSHLASIGRSRRQRIICSCYKAVSDIASSTGNRQQAKLHTTHGLAYNFSKRRLTPTCKRRPYSPPTGMTGATPGNAQAWVAYQPGGAQLVQAVSNNKYCKWSEGIEAPASPPPPLGSQGIPHSALCMRPCRGSSLGGIA